MSDRLDTIVDDGRLALALLFLAFLLTFVITRAITRLIRAGRGPFHNNVRDGVHIHHAVPGLFLLLGGAIAAVALDGRSPGAQISAVFIGIGASLVLDEFALILHTKDVYWSAQGQLSVQVVLLTTAALGFLTVGVDPLTVGSIPWVHAGLWAVMPLHIATILVCVSKGKYSTAVIGAFVPPVAWCGALRLARPHSHWARRHYSATRVQEATTRAAAFDARYGKWGLTVEDWVAGAPTATPQPASAQPASAH